MYKINNLQHGKRFVRDFQKYQKSLSFAALSCSISGTAPTRVKIPHARFFHELISISLSCINYYNLKQKKMKMKFV